MELVSSVIQFSLVWLVYLMGCSPLVRVYWKAILQRKDHEDKLAGCPKTGAVRKRADRFVLSYGQGLFKSAKRRTGDRLPVDRGIDRKPSQ